MGDEEERIGIVKLVCTGETEGEVEFRQKCKSCPTKVRVRMRRLASGRHGFHIHQYGDTRLGCGSSGGHFNPHGVDHGGRSNGKDGRHVGDLGNITADSDGNVQEDFEDQVISLFGDYSIIGRTVVVHAGEDDLGLGGFEDSKRTGHAGARVCCGVVGIGKSD